MIVELNCLKRQMKVNSITLFSAKYTKQYYKYTANKTITSFAIYLKKISITVCRPYH